VDTATKQLIGDLRLAHGSATNQFTDWRIMLTLDRAEAEEGPDYYLVGLAGPHGPSGTRPSADRRLPRTLPSNVKTTNVLTPSGPRVDDAEVACWVAPWDAALRATEAGRDYDEARAGAGQTARSWSRPEACPTRP